MPLSTTNLGVLVSNIDADIWTYAGSKMTIAESGWDRLRVELVGWFPEASSAADFTASPDDGEWIGYRPFGSKNFWCQDVNFTPEGLNVWRAELDCLGLAADKAVKRTVSAATEMQNAENILEPGGPQRNRVQTMQRTVELELNFIQFTEPDTSVVGTMVTPPDPPATPSSVWSFLTDPTWHWPYGWVMAGMPTEQLVGVDAWLCRPRYVYEHRQSP